MKSFRRQRGIAFLGRGQELVATQHEIGVLRTNSERLEVGCLQELGDVGVLHEAVARDDTKKAGAQLADVEPFGRRHVRDLLASYGQEEVPLVDDAIDLEIVQQGYGSTGLVAGQVDRGAPGTRDCATRDVVDHAFDRQQAVGESGA